MKNKCLLTIVFFSSFFLFGCQNRMAPQNKQSAHIINEAKLSYRKQNYAKAHHLLLPLAKKQNPIAQYELAYLYYYGLGTPINYPQAKTWIRKSAIQGYKPAIQALEILADNN